MGFTLPRCHDIVMAVASEMARMASQLQNLTLFDTMGQMSIKEKVQQIIRQAEAEKAAELRRQKEGQSQWLAECQEKTRQQDVLEKARFEKGKKTLESTGVQRVMGEVLSILCQEDLEVQLHIREGYNAKTIGFFVEKIRGEEEITTSIGVSIELDNPKKIWVTDAHSYENAYGQDNLFNRDDRMLFQKIEDRIAQLIANGSHRFFKPKWEPPDRDTLGGY